VAFLFMAFAVLMAGVAAGRAVLAGSGHPSSLWLACGGAGLVAVVVAVWPSGGTDVGNQKVDGAFDFFSFYQNVYRAS
jgi:hypothetical protein